MYDINKGTPEEQREKARKARRWTPGEVVFGFSIAFLLWGIVKTFLFRGFIPSLITLIIGFEFGRWLYKKYIKDQNASLKFIVVTVAILAGIFIYALANN